MTKCPSTRTVLCGVALAVVLGGCTTVAPTVGAWKPAPVGASWAAQQRNTGSFGKDTQTAPTRVADVMWNGAPAIAIKGAAGTLLQQPTDGRWLAFLGPDGKPVRTFDPPLGWTQPIAVGGTWKVQQKVTYVPNGRTFEYEWGCTVAAYEKITVPAGSFDAFRLECASSTDMQDTYWVSPGVHPFLKVRSVRGPKNPAGPGTQEIELLKLPS